MKINYLSLQRFVLGAVVTMLSSSIIKTQIIPQRFSFTSGEQTFVGNISITAQCSKDAKYSVTNEFGRFGAVAQLFTK